MTGYRDVAPRGDDEKARRALAEEVIPLEAYTHEEIEHFLGKFADVPPPSWTYRVDEFKRQQAEEWGVPSYDHLQWMRESDIEQWEEDYYDELAQDDGFCLQHGECMCVNCRVATELEDPEYGATQIHDYYWSRRRNQLDRWSEEQEHIWDGEVMEEMFEEGLEQASKYWQKKWIEMMKSQLRYTEEEQELREEAWERGVKWLTRPTTGRVVLAPYGPGLTLPTDVGTHLSARFPTPPLMRETESGLSVPLLGGGASLADPTLDEWAKFAHLPYVDIDVHLRFARPPAAVQWWTFLIYMAPDENVVLTELLGTSGWGSTYIKPVDVGIYESYTPGVSPLRVYLPFNPVNCKGVPLRSRRNPMTYNTEARLVLVWCAPPYLDRQIDKRYDMRRMTPRSGLQSRPVEEWRTYTEADPVEDLLYTDQEEYLRSHHPWVTERHLQALRRAEGAVAEYRQMDFGDHVMRSRWRVRSVFEARQSGAMTESDYLTLMDLFGKMVNEETYAPETLNSRAGDASSLWEARNHERDARTWAQAITGSAIFGGEWTPEWLFHNGPVDVQDIEDLLALVDIPPDEKDPTGGLILDQIENIARNKFWFGMETFDLSMPDLMRRMVPWFRYDRQAHHDALDPHEASRF